MVRNWSAFLTGTTSGVIALSAVAIGAAALAAAPAPLPAPAADAAKGKVVFARCAVCHKIDPTVAGGIGPNLAGVYGRAAGKQPGYVYSAAMKGSGLKWDDATLSRFLAAPSKVVPGTKMMAAPVAVPQDRANLIAFLKTASGKK